MQAKIYLALAGKSSHTLIKNCRWPTAYNDIPRIPIFYISFERDGASLRPFFGRGDEMYNSIFSSYRERVFRRFTYKMWTRWGSPRAPYSYNRIAYGGSRDRFPTSSEKNCCTVQLLCLKYYYFGTVQPVQDRSRRFDSGRAQKKRIFLYFPSPAWFSEDCGRS